MAGTFYALVPAWAQGEGIDTSTIALFMFVFYFMAAAALALALVAWFGSLRTASPLHQERPFDILPPQASLLAHAARSCSEEPSSAYPSEAAPA